MRFLSYLLTLSFVWVPALSYFSGCSVTTPVVDDSSLCIAIHQPPPDGCDSTTSDVTIIYNGTSDISLAHCSLVPTTTTPVRNITILCTPTCGRVLCLGTTGCILSGNTSSWTLRGCRV